MVKRRFVSVEVGDKGECVGLDTSPPNEELADGDEKL
jgi:hypothetical protein